eukprot:3042753-Pyramimonas_sp.AAC.1
MGCRGQLRAPYMCSTTQVAVGSRCSIVPALGLTPILAVSGINLGPNLSTDVLYRLALLPPMTPWRAHPDITTILSCTKIVSRNPCTFVRHDEVWKYGIFLTPTNHAVIPAEYFSP